MITCVRYENLDFTFKAFQAQFKLRHRCFIERQNYNVSSYNKMEYDQYDTPATVYLVYQSDCGEALGVSRLIPITQGCMIKDLWPDMVDDHHMFQQNNIWEGTRFCIDKSANVSIRRKIAIELVLAYLEFGLDEGAEKIIGVMPERILHTVFRSCGVSYTATGPIKLIDGIRIQGASMDISQEQLMQARMITRVNHPVLRGNNQTPINKAA